MCGFQEMIEVRERTELRVHIAVVLDGVIRAKSAFAALDTDRIERHKPHDISAKFLKFRQFSLRGRQSAFRRGLTDVQLIDYGILGPVTCLDRGLLSFIATSHRRGDYRQ